MALPKQYDPQAHETAVYDTWEKSGAFCPNQAALDDGRPPYVIMLPPPNITGSLHMGHALQDTLIDALIRYHRMQGEPTLWLPGTDHAAIATNKVLETQLQAEGKTRWDLTRAEFLQRAEAWYQTTGTTIISQMKRLGCSCDWSRERFTMDNKYVQAVNAAFIAYFNQGYLYRGLRIVNWDPKAQTTVSDLEIEYKTEKTPYYYLQYGSIEISTARPETKFGDKYVVVHPDDPRYAHLKHGDQFEAEWINGPITATVIKDTASDPAIGSGAMTITPWHSVVDFEIAQRHHLDMEPIIDLNGRLLPIAGEFAGMTIAEARPKIVAKLEQKGLLNRIDEKYEHNLALNSRGNGVIEPQVMRQWFINMEKIKANTIKVATDDTIQFVPPHWKAKFINWMENVRDWNISRQIWLGHRLPVWWKPGTRDTDHEEGNYVISVDKPADGEWEQDPDVLDTWFSSALWPFATLGWPEATTDLKTFYPTSLLVTARDILYLWVARMIFSGLDLLKDPQFQRPEISDRIPFRQVLIHPTILAKNGQRMSKSLGTGIDPLELIDKYGADATRFGLLFQISYDTQALKFDEEAIKSARNFANKIWNIGRYLDSLDSNGHTTIADTWIQSRLNEVIQQVSQLINDHKLGEAARTLYDFIWKDYADWYLEIIKTDGSPAVAKQVFRQILALLHPFMPHLTEILWQNFGDTDALITSAWPTAGDIESDSLTAITRFQQTVTALRSARKLFNLSPSETITVWVADPVIPSAFQRLVKCQLESEHLKSGIMIPVSGADPAELSAPSLTADKLAQGITQLKSNQAKLTQLISQHHNILEKMQGKAPDAIIAAKTTEVATLRQELDQITRSLELLA